MAKIYEVEQVSDAFQIVIEVSISLRAFLSLYITAQYQPNPRLDTIYLKAMHCLKEMQKLYMSTSL